MRQRCTSKHPPDKQPVPLLHLAQWLQYLLVVSFCSNNSLSLLCISFRMNFPSAIMPLNGAQLPLHILFVFLDGIGLGENNQKTNPLVRFDLPHFNILAGNQPWSGSFTPVDSESHVFTSIDATLGDSRPTAKRHRASNALHRNELRGDSRQAFWTLSAFKDKTNNS